MRKGKPKQREAKLEFEKRESADRRAAAKRYHDARIAIASQAGNPRCLRERRPEAKDSSLTSAYCFREPKPGMMMACGKHKGQPFDLIPDDHLQWLLGRDNIYPSTRSALLRYLTLKCTEPPIAQSEQPENARMTPP